MADHTSFKLRLLHLSDLHERGPRERESWRRRWACRGVDIYLDRKIAGE